ncbi:MAG: thioesterase family protein [Myxococcota bacterium]
MVEGFAGFYEPDGTAFMATPLTRGPWDTRLQHGGPPSALLAQALADYPEGDDAFVLTRLNIDFRRGVPIDRLSIAVEPIHLGRTTQRLRASLLHEDRVVLEAQGLRVRTRTDGPDAEPPIPPWPAPDSVEPTVLDFFQHDVAYNKAVELRIVGGTWGSTPLRVWTRPRVPLVAGRSLTAIEHTVLAADAQSGMGVPVDPLQYAFANPDLTVMLDRMPKGEWVGFDIRSTARPHGVGLSESLIRDMQGSCGRSAQTLIVSPRAE